jgi:hypothetical protein
MLGNRVSLCWRCQFLPRPLVGRCRGRLGVDPCGDPAVAGRKLPSGVVEGVSAGSGLPGAEFGAPPRTGGKGAFEQRVGEGDHVGHHGGEVDR